MPIGSPRNLESKDSTHEESPPPSKMGSVQRNMESKVEMMGMCPSCSRFVPARAVPSDTRASCFECSLGGVGCFGRRKRNRTKYLLQSHGEMVSAVTNVSQINATLLERISTAEERAKQLELKFTQMEQEMQQKDCLCKTSEAVLDSTKKDNASLKKELASLKKEKSDLEEECRLLRLSCREYKQSGDVATTELANVKANLDKVSSSLEETEKSRNKLTSEKQSLVTKVNNLQSELDSAMKKKHELADLVDCHSEYKEQTEAELSKLKTQLEEVKEEKVKMEKDNHCNTNYLQREIVKMAERLKRRQRMIERLTAEKENLLVTLRQRTNIYDSDLLNWYRRMESQPTIPEVSNQTTRLENPVKAQAHDENLNTKILELQLQLDRRDGLVRALEDRVQYHEPDFTINTDEETAPYRELDLETTRPGPSNHLQKFKPEVTQVSELQPTKDHEKSSFVDSGIEHDKLRLDELTPNFTSTPKRSSTKQSHHEQKNN